MTGWFRNMLGRGPGSRLPTSANPFDTPVGAGRSSGALRQHRSLAPCLLNRTEQVKQVRTRLQQRLTAGPPIAPLLVLLPATLDDLHQLFVHRIGRIELDRLLRGAPIQQKLAVRWPDDPQVDAILASLEDQFWPELGRPAQQLPCSICFQLTLHPKRWTKDTELLARQWIDYVVQEWPPDPAGNFAVAFLCVIYNNDPEVPGKLTPTSQPLENFVAAVANQHKDNDKIVVLDRLPFVEQVDFDDWIAEIHDQLGDLELYMKLSNLGHLFKSNKPIRFCHVFEQVSRYFEAAEKCVYEGR